MGSIKVKSFNIGLMFIFVSSVLIYFITDLEFIPIVVGLVCVLLFITSQNIVVFDFMIILLPVMFYIKVPVIINTSAADFVVLFLFYKYILKMNNKSNNSVEINSLKTIKHYALGVIIVMGFSLFKLLSLENSLVLDSLVAIFKIFICLIYALLTIRYLSIYGKERFLRTCCYSTICFFILMIVGVIAYKLGIDLGLTFAGTFRATGTFEDPNLAATYVFIMTAFVMTYFSIKNKFLSLYLGIILALISVVLTSSKGALVALGVGLSCIVLLNLLIGKFQRVIALLMVYGACFLILYYLYLKIDFVQELAKPILNRYEEFTSNISGDESLVHREFLWKTAFQLGINNPILGVGVEQFRPAASKYTGINVWNIVHNTYLTFWSELGLSGVIAFFWIWFYLLIENFKSLRFNKNSIFYLFSMCTVSTSMYSISLGNFRALWMFIAYLLYEVYLLKYNIKIQKGAINDT